jgi:hypothetical protein
MTKAGPIGPAFVVSLVHVALSSRYGTVPDTELSATWMVVILTMVEVSGNVSTSIETMQTAAVRPLLNPFEAPR